jgi:nitroreductase
LLLDSPADVARFWASATPPGQGADSWAEGMRRAPVVVVPLSCKQAYLDRYAEADKGWTDRAETRWPVPYWHIDAGMASLLMLLTAVDAGLGACFFGIPPERLATFRAEFGVPEAFTPIGAITVGHRAADRRSPSLERGRRPIEEVVHRGGW